MILYCYLAILVYSETVNVFNFTRTAGFIMCVGFLYLFSKQRYDCYVGALLTLTASLIRFDVIYIMIGFAVLTAFLLFQKNNDHALTRSFVFLIVSVCLCFVFHKCSDFIYSSIKELAILKEYNRASANVMDYPIANYDEYIDKYSQIGVSESDYILLKTRMSNSDPSFFTKDLLEKIYRISPTSFRLRLSVLGDFFVTLKIVLHSSLAYSLFVACLFAYISDRKNRIAFLLILCLVFGYIFLFQLMNRVVIRVITCVFFFALASVLINHKEHFFYAGDKTFHTIEKKPILYFIFVSVLIISFCVSNTVEKHEKNDRYKEIYDYTEENDDYFFLFSAGSNCEYMAVDNLLLSNRYWDTTNTFYLTQFAVSPNEMSKTKIYGLNCQVNRNSVE